MRRISSKYTVAPIVALTLALCACGDEDWENETQKEEAFKEYSCKKLEAPNSIVASVYQDWAFDNLTDPGDRAVAIRTALMIVNGTIQPTCDPSSPHYEADVVNAWHEHMMSEYDSFTPEMAREEGVL